MSHVLREVDIGDPAIAHLRALWELVHDPNADFATKIDRVFECETDQLDLPYGFVSRIDFENERQTIEAAHGSDEKLQPGATHPLAESYCRETVRRDDGLFYIDDAHEEGWSDDPAYRRFQFGSYVGSTIEFADRTYGTFCFASSTPRDEPLAEGERMLVEMLAEWAGQELRVRATQSQLERQTEQVEELANVISHDLRNPLNIAQGQVQLLDERIRDTIDNLETAHHRIDDIIENMLTLARVDAPVRNPDQVSLDECASIAWEMVDVGDATLDITCSGVQIPAEWNRLQQLFENLFRNAVEHGGESVSVEVGTMDSGFYVADDGPGIPPDQRATVFEPGYSSTPSGTGFGLAIVRRIADAHGWDVTITESDAGGARFEFTGLDAIDRTETDAISRSR